MSYNSPEVVILSIEHPELHDKALAWVKGCNNVTEGVKVQVKQCDYNEAPKQLETGGPKLICTVSDHSDKVSLIFNKDERNQKTKEGQKPASLPQSATATYKEIGGQLGNGDFIDEGNNYIAKKTYDDEVAKEAGIARIFEAAKSSNSVIIHAPRLLTNLALELAKKIAEGMSPSLVLRREDFYLVEDPSPYITIDGALTHQCTMKRSEFKPCACAEGIRVCGIPTENKSKAKIVEDGVQEKQIEAEFLKFKTPETHGAQPYNESGLAAGLFRAHNALEKVCPAQAYGYAPWCRSMSVGIENFIWERGVKLPIDLAIVVVRSGNAQVCKLTKGITLQEAYVRRAKSFGHVDWGKEHGKVTAGAVIAAHTGYSAANWHLDIAGWDRYGLHEKALAEAMVEFKKKDVPFKREEDVAKLTFDMYVNFYFSDETGVEAAKRPLKAIMVTRDDDRRIL